MSFVLLKSNPHFLNKTKSNWSSCLKKMIMLLWSKSMKANSPGLVNENAYKPPVE